jgi:two-component system chemotaxis response regulator CheY
MLAGEDVEIVGEATNGVEAVTRYKKARPDIVLMDLVMPQMSGIEAARAILAHHPDAKIIPVSGLAHPSVMVEAESAGMLGFISKPVEREELIAEIAGAMEGR